ncbi:MAG TPA: hypothetical protein VN713_03035 [Sphingomicrobium sp.]|nr:hypothetical protein [Sphingomicrobium sp.]
MSEAPVETAVDDVQPKPRRTGFRHFDVITSIAAIFISAVSLYVAIEHGRTERDLVAANVWPFPREILSNDYGNDHGIAIGFSNAGVGPVKIRSYEVFYRGHPVSSNLDLLRKCCGLPADAAGVVKALPHGFYVSLADQTVWRPGEENPILVVHREASALEVPTRFRDSLKDLRFRVCYCSVLDQCWIGDLQSIHVEPVRECAPPKHPFDPNGP